MHSNPADLLKGYNEIVSLPSVFTRLNEALNNPKSSVNDLAAIISEDAGLTARLLMVVNSAFFNLPTRVESIPKAVTLVGTQQLREFALATCVMNMFKGIPPHLVDMETFWQHSIAVGIAAKSLATERHEANLERFFVAGVLHDVGRLVMYVKIPDLAYTILVRAKKENALLYLLEREVAGFDHAAVGACLVQMWKLPAYQGEVVAFHHHPKAAARFQIETAIIHLADVIVHSMELGNSGELLVPPVSPEACELLSFDPAALPAIVDQIESQFALTVQTGLGTKAPKKPAGTSNGDHPSPPDVVEVGRDVEAMFSRASNEHPVTEELMRLATRRKRGKAPEEDIYATYRL